MKCERQGVSGLDAGDLQKFPDVCGYAREVPPVLIFRSAENVAIHYPNVLFYVVILRPVLWAEGPVDLLAASATSAGCIGPPAPKDGA
jgi:hypothetical protein